MAYLINSSNVLPTEFQRSQASRYLDYETDLYIVRRETRETGADEVSSREWYLIAAEGIGDALECAEEETVKHYGGDWTHDHEIDG